MLRQATGTPMRLCTVPSNLSPFLPRFTFRGIRGGSESGSSGHQWCGRTRRKDGPMQCKAWFSTGPIQATTGQVYGGGACSDSFPPNGQDERKNEEKKETKEQQEKKDTIVRIDVSELEVIGAPVTVTTREHVRPRKAPKKPKAVPADLTASPLISAACDDK